MYADQTAKGNVLEPEGIVEIKFRTKELLECMGRLDKQLINLKAKLQEARSKKTLGSIESLQQQVNLREKQLLPLYTQIATKFAELHDTSLQMATKGVIREVLDYSKSRSFFYRRLRRRIGEHSLINTVRDATGDHLTHESAMGLIKSWYMSSNASNKGEDVWLDDESFFRWKNEQRNYEDKLKELRVQKLLIQLTSIGDLSLELQVLPQGFSTLLSKLEPPRRVKLVEELRKVIN